jgi:putative tryptophan/tyrosine transport system substrate-binding protein
MKKKIVGLSLGALLFALCGPVEAQQPTKIPRIGYLSGAGPDADNMKGFRQGLRDLGYIEGKSILIEFRNTGVTQDHIPSLVAELVHLKVDVLVVPTLTMIRAAMQATKTIPIVMVTSADPVATRVINSLARPGGNVTGITMLTRDLTGKRLELLKEIVPTISRVGFVLPESPDQRVRFKEYEEAAHALKIQLQSLALQRQNADFDGMIQIAVKAHVSALVIPRSSLLIVNRKHIAELAIKNRLPSMSERSDMVEAGGLVSYGSNEADSSRRAAVYVDKILKGAKPADLPVEQPTKFELVINLKTAKALNLTIPSHVLLRADKVIK